MREIFLNQLIDIIDPECEFVNEFDYEIKKYGALCYNHETNSYQFIKNFDSIDFKKEFLPDFVRVEQTEILNHKGMKLTVHYEFDPDTEDDAENIDIWQKELSKIQLPVYKYEDDGELEIDHYIKFYPSESIFTIWFLDKRSYEYILDVDLLLLTPIIKNINIVKALATKYIINPFEYQYDASDLDNYIEPTFDDVKESKKDA